MTDRYNALIVTLEKDTRDDDAEHLINALGMMRGVLSVKGHVSDFSDHIAEDRALHHWRQKIIELLWPKEEK